MDYNGVYIHIYICVYIYIKRYIIGCIRVNYMLQSHGATEP